MNAMDLKAERSALEEMKAMDAYLAWQANPCGKPALKLIELDILAEPIFSKEERSAVQVKGVDLYTSERGDRSVALEQLQAAIWRDTAYPVPFAFYAGWQEDGSGPRRWVIEVYAEGEPYPMQPEPPKPDLMK